MTAPAGAAPPLHGGLLLVAASQLAARPGGAQRLCAAAVRLVRRVRQGRAAAGEGPLVILNDGSYL